MSRTWRAALSVSLLLTASIATGAASDGPALYRQRCARCHGDDGRGGGPDAEVYAPQPPDLRSGVLARSSTDILAGRLLDGRPLSLNLPAMRARAADVESLVAYLQRLPDIDWPTTDAGDVLYAARCEPCHDAYGSGARMLPPGVRTPRDLADPAFQRTVSDGDLIVAVRHGRAGMPALTPRLSEEQARQVAAFVRLLSPGYVTYTQYCAGCHGDHGVGGGSFAESFNMPTVIFDRAYFAGHDAEDLRSKVWHMLDAHRLSMPHFRGTLSALQAQAIIAYLKTGRDH